MPNTVVAFAVLILAKAGMLFTRPLLHFHFMRFKFVVSCGHS